MPFGVSPIGVLLGALAAFAIGMLWYSPFLFGRSWAALNGYSGDKLEALKKGVPRAYAVSFVAYLILGTGLGSMVAGETAGAGAWIGVQVWSFLVMPVTLTMLVYSERKFAAWLIDAMYQLVYFAAMGAILSRWGWT